MPDLDVFECNSLFHDEDVSYRPSLYFEKDYEGRNLFF